MFKKNSAIFVSRVLLTLLTILFSFSSARAAAQEDKQQVGRFTLVVAGLRSNNGQVRVGLYNTKESYHSRGKLPALLRAKLKIDHNKAVYTFEDIPYGEYTIKLYHDENGNDKLDKNFLGIPKEPYGFSNNARGLGLPSYKKAKFTIASKEMSMEINMD